MAEEAIDGGTLGDGADDHLNQKRPNLEDIDDENVLHSMVKYLNACTVPLATTRVGGESRPCFVYKVLVISPSRASRGYLAWLCARTKI